VEILPPNTLHSCSFHWFPNKPSRGTTGTRGKGVGAGWGGIRRLSNLLKLTKINYLFLSEIAAYTVTTT
jgi:hypothetical protein